MTPEEEKRKRHRDAVYRYRQRLRDKGINPHARNDEQRATSTRRAREYRAAAHAQGRKLPSETWWQNNPEKHRQNVRQWRTNNVDRARHVTRIGQAKRRSTPWGLINNRIWSVMHGCVRRNSGNASKYTAALGYLWSALRAHLEARFEPGMTWENWGDVWELDHIKPLSSFLYTSLDDPLFRKAWALNNLRPLARAANAAKGKCPLYPL